MRARLKKWILLTGHRYVVASGILVLMTGVVLLPGLNRFVIRNTTPLFYIASALITGNITLITVVVAINQVILSQELESPGSLRDEIERTDEYRQAALDEPTASTEHSEFLRQLLQQTSQRALSLREVIPEASDESSHRLLQDLPAHCNRVADRIELTANYLSNVVVPLLGVAYGDYIHDCRQLQTRYEEESHDQLHAILSDLMSDLENIDVARQYFTTTFMKEELAMLSRSLLYIGILAVSTPIALLIRLITYGGATPAPTLFALAVLTAVFGLAPLAILIAFVVRIATVTQYIAAITPFKA